MIRELSALYSISEICEALNVSRSGYHGAEQRQKNLPEEKCKTNISMSMIERVYRENHRCYGSPRVTRQLRLQGETCSENRVARLMRQKGLKAKPKKAFRPRTTIRAREELIAPNHLAQLSLEPDCQEWIKSGSATSPMCPPPRAGSIWPRSWILKAEKSSAGPWRIIWTLH